MRQATDKKNGTHLKVMVSGGLGDCLLLSPFFRYFRNSGRYDKIICAIPAGAAEIYDKNPNIDQVIPCAGKDLYLWGLPEKNGSVFSPYLKVTAPEKLGANMHIDAVPIHGFSKIGKGIIPYLSDFYGFELQDETLEIYTTEKDAYMAETILSPFTKKPLILINRKSSYKEKEYPTPLWQEIVDQLSKHAAIIEFAPKSCNLRNVQVIESLPRIRVSAEIYKRLSCVVTVDSFPQHLACAVGIPAVVLFGPSNIKAFGHAANTNIRAVPDFQGGIPGVEVYNSLFQMRNIEPKTVVEAALHRCSLSYANKKR